MSKDNASGEVGYPFAYIALLRVLPQLRAASTVLETPQRPSDAAVEDFILELIESIHLSQPPFSETRMIGMFVDFVFGHSLVDRIRFENFSFSEDSMSAEAMLRELLVSLSPTTYDR